MTDSQAQRELPRDRNEFSLPRSLREMWEKAAQREPRPLPERRLDPPAARREAAAPVRAAPAEPHQRRPPKRETVQNIPLPEGMPDGKTLGEIFADAFRKGTARVITCMKPLHFNSVPCSMTA